MFVKFLNVYVSQQVEAVDEFWGTDITEVFLYLKVESVELK